MVEILAALGGADCERIRSGWLAQPANAVSSLTYVAVGAWLLWRQRASGVRRGVLIAGGVAMIAVGVGSFAYHGPQPGWAHPAHNASILALALVMVGDHIRLLARASGRPAAGSAAASLMAAWRPAAPWIVPALLTYWAGRTGSRLCSPSAVWQPHAAWHALIALGLSVALTGLAQWSAPGPKQAPEPIPSGYPAPWNSASRHLQAAPGQWFTGACTRDSPHLLRRIEAERLGAHFAAGLITPGARLGSGSAGPGTGGAGGGLGLAVLGCAQHHQRFGADDLTGAS